MIRISDSRIAPNQGDVMADISLEQAQKAVEAAVVEAGKIRASAHFG